jgi:hypothetical protein
VTVTLFLIIKNVKYNCHFLDYRSSTSELREAPYNFPTVISMELEDTPARSVSVHHSNCAAMKGDEFREN